MISYLQYISFYLVITIVHSISFQTFHAHSQVSNIAIHNNSLFIGSTNSIYHVDSNLNIIQSLTIGPVDGVDNVVTLMLVHPDPDKPVLFWCGSVGSGLCHVTLLSNLHAGDYLDEQYFTDILEDLFQRDQITDKGRVSLLEAGLFGHLGTQGARAIFVDISSNEQLSTVTRTKYSLLASSVYDPSRQERELPMLGLYSILQSPNRDYFIKPIVINPVTSAYSWISISEQIAHRYPVHHMSMFDEAEYVYMVTIQRQNISSSPLPFQTRVARFDKYQLKFQKYIEVPVECKGSNHDHNIGMDAHIGEAKGMLAGKLEVQQGERILFMLQGESSDADEYPTANSATVCAISLSELNDHMDREERRCHRGNGNIVEWYKGYETNCETMTKVNTHTGERTTRSMYTLMKGRKLSLTTVLVLPYNATMIHTETQGETTVAVIGSNTGSVSKINLGTGQTYGSYQVSSGGSFIHRDAQILQRSGDLMILTGSEVLSFPLRSCSLYNDADSCTGADDPLRCGWCNGQSCKTEFQCLESGSVEWYRHAPPPSLMSVLPVNGSISGSTTLTLSGTHFTRTQSNQPSTVSVILNNVICAVTSLQFNRITCNTGAMSSPWTGEVMVVRKDIGSGNMSNIALRGHSPEVVFSYLIPTLDGSTPLIYGPRSGSTLVTLPGSNLNIGTSTTVRIGEKPCDIISVAASKIRCLSRPSLYVGSAALLLYSDGVLQASVQYQYMPDPWINPNQTQQKITSLFSGGIPVCIEGEHLDSVSNPRAQVDYDLGMEAQPSKEHSVKCDTESDTRVCCRLPSLEHMITLRHASSLQSLTANVTLVLDGLRSKLAEVSYYQKPTITSAKSVRVNKTTALLTIKGVGFETLYPEFLTIQYGGVKCSVKSVMKTRIECTAEVMASAMESQLQAVFTYGYLKEDLGRVVISAISTHTMPQAMSEPQSFSSTTLVIALAGALSVGVISASLVVFCMMRRNRKKLHHVEDGRVSYIHGSNNRSVNIQLADNEAYQGAMESTSVELSPMMGVSSLRNELERRGVLIELSSLHIGREIGSGCFGKVFRGVLDQQEEDNTEIVRVPVAIKTIKGCHVGMEEIQTFVDEALLMSSFRDENVLSMLGVSFDIYGQPLVILPYLGNGDLLSYLRTNNKVILEDMLRFTTDIAMGMNYLQNVLCVHRDLAARNCMLDDNLRVKVADFGLSRDLMTFSNVYQSTARGAKLPVKWMAPESIETRQYTSKSDMWSFGVTMWEIFSRGSHPYAAVDNMDILTYVKSGGRLKRPSQCPTQLYEWMLSAWRMNPEERPDFSEVVGELQLHLSHHEMYTGRHTTYSESDVTDDDIMSLRTRSSDSGNHSADDNLSLTQVVLVEDYMIPMPSTDV